MKEQTLYNELIEKLREERKYSMEAATELLNEDMRESLGEISLIDSTLIALLYLKSNLLL